MKTETAKIYDLLYRSFVGKYKDDLRFACVKHKDGFLYASNNHVLAKVKAGYPLEKEGKSFTKSGGEEANNIDYELPIPKRRDEDLCLSDDYVKTLKAAVRNIGRTRINGMKVVIDIGHPTVYYKDKDCHLTFLPYDLEPAFRLFDITKESPRIRISGSKIMAIESDTGATIALITPVMLPVDEGERQYHILTVQEAIEYKNSKEKAWYEDK
jgi:hypothetical protein